MEREKIKLSVDELSDIIFEDSEEFEVVEQETTGTWRHGNEEEAIIKRLKDNKFFRLNYRTSVKDECSFSDMNYDGEYVEVFPTPITKIVYK